MICKLVLKDEDLEDKLCPICKHQPEEMCARDHCHCSHVDPMPSIAYCPDCGKPMCPLCESHDVTQISRVTGYLQAVEGWNKAKQQELKDRTHYNI